MNPAASPRVLIAGAGPTGLTLACELARRGIPFRIIDAALEPFTGSRGKGLQPRTLEVLEDLGVIDRVLASGCLYPRLRLHWRQFTLGHWSMFERRAPTPEVPYPNTWLIPPWRTEAILHEQLTRHGHAVERGTELTGFQPDAPCVDAAGRPVRLFDAFRGPHWTLLAFGPNHADTLAWVGARFGGGVRAFRLLSAGDRGDKHDLIDAGGHARAGYGLEGNGLALIRPDGYVGLISRSGTRARLEEYLEPLAPAPARQVEDIAPGPGEPRATHRPSHGGGGF